jgi:DNA modification methylase
VKPFYSDPWTTLYLGDCLEVIPALESEAFDAIVTDPPYCSGAIGEAQRSRANGQGLRSENLRRFGWFVGDNMGTAGLVWLLRSLAVESRRLVKETGSLLLFCDWRMVPNVVPAIESAGLRYQDLVVWDKGHFGLGNGFRRQHELVAHFTYGSPEYHDRSTGNVIKAARAEDREHQTQKPEDLMRRLIKVVTPPGGTLLDAFAGSGSTLRAAKDLGRHSVGIEVDEQNAEIAARRLEQNVLNFDSPPEEPTHEQPGTLYTEGDRS